MAFGKLCGLRDCRCIPRLAVWWPITGTHIDSPPLTCLFELHAVQLHCWRKCQLNNKLTPPCDVPLSCIGMQYLQTEYFTPSPVAQWKSLFFHNTLLLHRDSPLKGAFKWPKFSLISAHHYYTETPHEFNILTSQSVSGGTCICNTRNLFKDEKDQELQICRFQWSVDIKRIVTDFC